MSDNILKQLSEHDIHPFGSSELLKFEKQMTRYFEREYIRWKDNKNSVESYGVSSFEGDMATNETHAESVEHYNKELKIYQGFLDKKHLVYTMAYYGATDSEPVINKDLSLEQAQIDKYDLIIKRADIHDGQEILELGCGFGGFANYLLETFPAIKVTGINPSVVQATYIRETLATKNRHFDNNRFTLIQKFFGELSTDDFAGKKFDRAISIGALEAVNNMEKFFELISQLLKQGGKSFHHCIVSKDTIPQFLNAENTLIADYYPGGHVWPYAEPMRHDKHLQPVKSWFVNGLNYWKTLDDWHALFWKNIEELYPEYLTVEEVADWNKYFCLCKTMFNPDKGRSYGNGHFLFEKN
ncbi:MAG: methyltransferase [Gammaproteobacteria bacterium]|nr:methyltransferase [Gammaproteobacteria bacterium]